MREAIKILDSDSLDKDFLKVKADIIKTVMYPLLNKGTIDINSKEEVIFRAVVGKSGTILQEVIEVESSNQPKQLITGG